MSNDDSAVSAGFETNATTTEDFYKDLFRHTVNQWSARGLLAPSAGITKESGVDDVKDADSFTEKLQSLRMDQYKARGGFAADENMTPTDQGYAQRRYDYLKSLEGEAPFAYDDNGDRSVGLGFNMSVQGHREIFKKSLGVDDAYFDEVYQGKRKLTPIQMRQLFDSSADEYEGILNKRLGDTVIPENQRLALLSMTYNSPSLIGPKITAAVKSGDVSSALTEILHNSNANNSRLLASRRYKEAQMFAGYANTAALPDVKSYLKGYA